jgi:hypothetical protein
MERSGASAEQTTNHNISSGLSTVFTKIFPITDISQISELKETVSQTERFVQNSLVHSTLSHLPMCLELMDPKTTISLYQKVPQLLKERIGYDNGYGDFAFTEIWVHSSTDSQDQSQLSHGSEEYDGFVERDFMDTDTDSDADSDYEDDSDENFQFDEIPVNNPVWKQIYMSTFGRALSPCRSRYAIVGENVRYVGLDGFQR